MASLELLHCPGCNSLFLSLAHFNQHNCPVNSPVQPLILKDNMATVYREEEPHHGQGAACQPMHKAATSTVAIAHGEENETTVTDISPATPVQDEKQTWTNCLTKGLINLRGELDAEFASKKKTHKALWKEIAAKLKEEYGFTGDWLQCQSKFNKLTAKYKAVEDANKKSGERRRSMEFYEEMMEVMGDDPKITPLKTISVGVGKRLSIISGEKGEKGEGHERVSVKVGCEKVKNVSKRKREDELIDLLTEVRDDRRKFQEEQMRVNERKLVLMEKLVSLLEK
ncbi:uncharacterized protein LOC133198558 isoform X1 [Saccostrea echinata]|uniref:uncharacterized protein LOC133198558 isoform X1 n=1 Tax=Saccostrea echinata TaxID=191078 RepID=UPI002A7F62F2|nr:uncharacterized protein LOC133198558 isoform X1 [Saccostrea echinata]